MRACGLGGDVDPIRINNYLDFNEIPVLPFLDKNSLPNEAPHTFFCLSSHPQFLPLQLKIERGHKMALTVQCLVLIFLICAVAKDLHGSVSQCLQNVMVNVCTRI